MFDPAPAPNPPPPPEEKEEKEEKIAVAVEEKVAEGEEVLQRQLIDNTDDDEDDTADAALAYTYETGRTAHEIAAARWTRVALQFPDGLLADAPRVVALLTRRLAAAGGGPVGLSVLADSSFAACCVDEVAAAHAQAQAVVHYGRACLSRTGRLPVVFVFTRRPLDLEQAAAAFVARFPDRDAPVVLAADVPYQHHLPAMAALLRRRGYTRLWTTDVVHEPLATIPNRSLLPPPSSPTSTTALLNPTDYTLFHVSAPPTALLLALLSRFRALAVLPTPCAAGVIDPTASAAALLRRRYARVAAVATAGVIGILVNTLSVTDYLEAVATLRRRIAAAGKKSYTVAVGRVNPAKLANLPEMDGWVAVGCWESGLVDGGDGDGDAAAYWKPIVTPLELEVALTPAAGRVWGPDWWAGIERLHIDRDDVSLPPPLAAADEDRQQPNESDPPEFDLSTGKLVGTSRPMQLAAASANRQEAAAVGGGVVAVRTAAGQVARINGVVSPGADFLRFKRTWQGLGSDFGDSDTLVPDTAIAVGRTGLARGYAVGDSTERR